MVRFWWSLITILISYNVCHGQSSEERDSVLNLLTDNNLTNSITMNLLKEVVGTIEPTTTEDPLTTTTTAELLENKTADKILNQTASTSKLVELSTVAPIIVIDLNSTINPTSTIDPVMTSKSEPTSSAPTLNFNSTGDFSNQTNEDSLDKDPTDTPLMDQASVIDPAQCFPHRPGEMDFQTVDLISVFKLDWPHAPGVRIVQGSQELQRAYRIRKGANLTLPVRKIFPSGIPEYLSIVGTFNARGYRRPWSFIRFWNGASRLSVTLNPQTRKILAIVNRLKVEFDGKTLFLPGWHKIHMGFINDSINFAIDCVELEPENVVTLRMKSVKNNANVTIISNNDGTPANIDLQWLSISCNQFQLKDDSCDEIESGFLTATDATTAYDLAPSGYENPSRGETCDITCPPGPEGPPGPPGLQGPRGFTGLPGVRGIEGPPGETGLPGLRGERGLPGEPGSFFNESIGIGLRGFPGPPGLPGPKGDRGDPGPIGGQGIPGLNGEKGEHGLTGLPGLPGIMGLRGPQGPPGPAGPPGPTVRMEPEFRQGMKGDKGDSGTRGTNGFPGPMGPPGYPGAKGEDGTPGLPGHMGMDGPQGPVGPRGLPGLPGLSGLAALGTPGLPGEKGEKGESGLIGLPGRDGMDGIPGTPGPIGPPGLPVPHSFISQLPTLTEGEVRSICLDLISERLAELTAGLSTPPPFMALGRRGPRGAPGPPGLPGPRGYDGDTGSPGNPGMRGEPGMPGLSGLNGDKGDKGERGPEGVGLPGPEGPRGSEGPVGPPGLSGRPGARGDPGREGPRGIPGPRGSCSCPTASAAYYSYVPTGNQKGP